MYKNIAILICLFGVPQLTYRQDREQLLKGHWQINFEETLNLVAPARHAQYDSLDTHAKEEMQANMAGQCFEFRADQGFSASMADGQSYTGTWELIEDDTRRLVLTYEQGVQFNQAIETLEPEMLVLQAVENENSPALFHYLYLTRP